VRLEPVLGVPGRDTISFSAGALEAPTGLSTIDDIYTEFRSDYHD
jgi:hypothetical protein